MKLRIEKAIYGGDGLARLSQGEAAGSSTSKAVFIPCTLPDELVEARITGERRGYATGELVTVIESSPDRIAPVCEYFGICGGCQYQQAGAEAQLRIKLGILKETLQRAHLPEQPGFRNVQTLSAQPWGYRNRVRLRIRKNPGALGGIALCYRERGSHRDLSVTHCPIAAPLIERAMTAVLRRDIGVELTSLAEEVEFFTNDAQDALLVKLIISPAGHTSRQSFESFCNRLQAELPEFRGAGLFLEGKRHALYSWGERTIAYTVSAETYEISIGSFFQVNRFLLPDLVRIVTGGRSGRLAWDLYAGAGLFSRRLDFDQVLAVEADPSAAADLKRNLPRPRRAIHSTALEFLRNQSRRIREAPDLIVADPPRSGLGREMCQLLAQIAPRSIVYVSCDPATMARDLRLLLHSGFRVEKMSLIDLFPQTFHIETVTELATN